MRRNITTAPVETGRKKSALEEMIPETSIRGRRRPPPGSINGVGKGSSTNGTTGFSSPAEAEALKLFNAFKARLESADATTHHNENQKGKKPSTAEHEKAHGEGEEDEEAQLCDLHFIANCQSCKVWDNPDAETGEAANEDDDRSWMTHELRFGKDTLGKDLNWKRQHEEADSLVVIDPREREKEIVGERRKGRASERDRERELKRGRTGDLEWDRERRRK
jgi:peptidyl-prolyl cis-trans isomerase SDCCAG10